MTAAIKDDRIPKSLFDKNERFTKDAQVIYNEADQFLRVLFKKYGPLHGARMVAHILNIAILDNECEYILGLDD